MKLFYIIFVFLLQYNSSNFTFKNVYNVPSNDIRAISYFLQSEYDSFKKKIKFKLNFKTEVIFCSSLDDFINKTSTSSNIGAIYKNKKIFLQPIEILKRKGILYNILKHELIHLIFECVNNPNIPKWFNESYAIYFSGDLDRVRKKVKIKFDSLTDIESYLKSKKYDEVQTSYYYLGLVMQYLITNYGEDRINALLVDNNNYSFRDSFEKELGEKYDNVEQKIIEYLKKH